MMNRLAQLQQLLVEEEVYTNKLGKTQAAKNLQNSRNALLTHIREVGRGGDLSLIVATERAITEGDLARYANSSSMVKESLNNSPT
jgi:hypothetical protein